MSRNRLHELLLYTAIASAFVAALIGLSGRFHQPISGNAVKWAGLAIQTPLLFGYAIVDHRRMHKQISFWAVILVLIVIHLAVFFAVLRRVESWSPLWYVAFFPLENVAIDAILIITGHLRPNTRRRQVETGTKSPDQTI